MRRFLYFLERIHILPIPLFFFLLGKISKCKTCYDGYFYPYYGLAPHHYEVVGVTADAVKTVIHDRAEWPDNFAEDPEAPTCGVYGCPNKKCGSE